jgi:4-amino-4-deoxy-L-arabinose transferase-like glycosyltransferase
MPSGKIPPLLSDAPAWQTTEPKPHAPPPPASRDAHRVDRALQALLAVVSVAFILGFLVAAYFRVTYPYPLAPMEAPSVQMVRRILHGLPLYGPPTLEYVPAVYAPLYFYIGAAVSVALGPTLAALRLVSVVSSVGSSALIAFLVWRETRQSVPAMAAASIFLCSTAWSETILDLARVDALSVLFMVASVAAARAGARNAVWILISGVLAGLAVLTKQTAIAVAIVLAIDVILGRALWRFAAFAIGCLGALSIGFGALALQYGAWPALYLLDLPRQHALMPDRLAGFWSVEILPAFTLPLVLLPIFLLGRWLSRERDAVRFWLLVALGMLGMAWGASLNRWSGSNVVSPAFAILAIGFGFGLAEGLWRLQQAGYVSRVFSRYLLALALLEFAFVHYNPRSTSPLRSDGEAGQRYVAAIAALPGTVYAPEFPELAYQAGKGEAAFGLSIGELQGIFGGRPRPPATAWTTAYAEALDERRFDYILLETDGVLPFVSDATRDHGYIDTGPLIPSGDEFYRLASPYMPAVHVWVPRERGTR